MQILEAASYNAAKYLGNTGLKAMKERGRLQKGMVADITILDPKTVRDNATYAKGTLPTTGIPYVIVDGTIVVERFRGVERRQSRSTDPVPGGEKGTVYTVGDRSLAKRVSGCANWFSWTG